MGEKRPGDSGPSAGVARLFFPACLSGRRSVRRRPRLAPIASIPSLIRRPPRHFRSARLKLTAIRPPSRPARRSAITLSNQSSAGRPSASIGDHGPRTRDQVLCAFTGEPPPRGSIPIDRALLWAPTSSRSFGRNSNVQDVPPAISSSGHDVTIAASVQTELAGSWLRLS